MREEIPSRQLRLSLVFVLAVLWSGCKEYPPEVKEGALFAAPEKAYPAQALVYVYWPLGEQGRRKHLWVGNCESFGQEILPGGYTALVVEPGPSCFHAKAQSEFVHSRASVSRSLGNVKFRAEPGRTYFLRLGRERFLFFSRTVLRLVKPAVAGPEIRKCRQSIPLTPAELAV